MKRIIITAAALLMLCSCAGEITPEPTTATTTTAPTTTTTTAPTTEGGTEVTSTTRRPSQTAPSATSTTRVWVPSPELENSISPQSFRRLGRVSDEEWTYTWYSERVLPGGGLDIPGRHSDGNYVRDENDYIVLASSELPKGTVLETPFGGGKVYDTGCPYGVIDVYVSF